MEFLYRGQKLSGELLEQTKTHYIVELEDSDQTSLSKEVTTILNGAERAREICHQLVKEAKRNPYGKHYEKLTYFRICLIHGLVSVDKASYKKYTTNQMLKLIEKAGL